MSFDSLKRNRSANFDKLTQEIQKLNTPQQGSQDDNRFWKPEVDKAGNGYAIIRFLPAPGMDGDEALPYVRIWDHGFQGPGGWYIEKSLTTIGQKDPVSEYNSQLWNSGIEANKELVRKYKRRLGYISNIYVVKDPSHPENEGKVFLYRYGKKIWDKIELAMNPEFEDETKINPFDFWDGANFKLKIRNVEGYRNYDKSEFEAAAPLGEDDELQSIYDQLNSLSAFVAPKEFKTYDELKDRLNRALGLTAGAAPKTTVESYDDDVPFVPDTPTKTASAKTAPAAAEPSLEEDDGMDFFRKLAEEEN